MTSHLRHGGRTTLGLPVLILALACGAARADVDPVASPGVVTDAGMISPSYLVFADQQTFAPATSAHAVAWGDNEVPHAQAGSGLLGCFGTCNGAVPGAEAQIDFNAAAGAVRLHSQAQAMEGGTSAGVVLYDTLQTTDPITFRMRVSNLAQGATGPMAASSIAALLFAHDGSSYDAPLLGFGVTTSVDSSGQVSTTEGFWFEGSSFSTFGAVPQTLDLSFTLTPPVDTLHLRWEFATTSSTSANQGSSFTGSAHTLHLGIDGNYDSVGGFNWIFSPVPEPSRAALLALGLPLLVLRHRRQRMSRQRT